MRQKGFDSYRWALVTFGELSLRPPIAPMNGPNIAVREGARAVIREAVATVDHW